MNRKTTSFLIGAATGIGLAWYYGKLVARGVKRVPIVLRKRDDGSCGVEPVADVELDIFPPEPMLWEITNPSNADGGCGKEVTVKIGGWRKGNTESLPAVLAVTFERQVMPGQTKPIPALANTLVGKGVYKYNVYIDDQLALDPIVKLIL
jgi:hypothetical protein